MKTRFLLLLLIISTTIPLTSFAEPQSYEDFMKTYQPILDRVYSEKLSPHKQTDIGLLMIDVVCFNNGIQVLKLSSQSHVACVNPDTASKLVQRGWGVVMYDETKYADGHGYECTLDWIIHYDDIKPKSSELIYNIRYAMKNIQESLLWHHVIIEDNSDTKTVIMHSVGNYSQEEIQKITDSLNSVSRVTSVGVEYGACI
jgi:hypothetical protein